MAQQKNREKTAFDPLTTLDLRSFEKFKAHPLVSPLMQRYQKDAILAECAVRTLVQDLKELNDDFSEKLFRTAFTTIEGRVKAEQSFLLKLHQLCRESSPSRGITQESLDEIYLNIRDLAGVRFSCPYYDEVKHAIEKLVRPWLSARGHATGLQEESGCKDKDSLDSGDDFGYRSYHFYVRVATVIDIYGTRKPVLCEVQARTELQHIWAVKSHDLLYKPETGWMLSDKHVAEDMRQVSNSLRAADQFLVSIRDRVIKGTA
ncbi:MAG TPA: RelA/SpoT domain-containing protein [Candidatus Angelobacter sp.]